MYLGIELQVVISQFTYIHLLTNLGDSILFWSKSLKSQNIYNHTKILNVYPVFSLEHSIAGFYRISDQITKRTKRWTITRDAHNFSSKQKL